jgi:hypothetical protein
MNQHRLNYPLLFGGRAVERFIFVNSEEHIAKIFPYLSVAPITISIIADLMKKDQERVI